MATGTARFWHADDLGDVELLRATASRHAYARHAHEGYALGVVEAGGHGFAARGEAWSAAPGDVIMVNPEDPHDGRPLGAAGYSYRMLYVAPALFAEALAELTERPARQPFFPRLVVRDPPSATMIGRLHRALEVSPDRLERETGFLGALAGLATRHATERPHAKGYARHRRIAERARDYLEANVANDVSLAELAGIAGVSRFHLLRVFHNELGLPPHAWLMQLRLRHAKRLLRLGDAPAGVAAALGFVDQSHLTRRFVGVYGVTPGRYRRQSNAVQSRRQPGV
jgi:AraC-like DNA-binding protein